MMIIHALDRVSFELTLERSLLAGARCHCDWASTAEKHSLPFSPVVSRTGTLSISVDYATNIPPLKVPHLYIQLHLHLRLPSYSLHLTANNRLSSSKR